jgi:hypothetical protein
MKKIIRLTQSELVSLVKTSIMETELGKFAKDENELKKYWNQKSDEEIQYEVQTYNGKNVILNNFREYLYSNVTLPKNYVQKAREELLSDALKSNEKLQKVDVDFENVSLREKNLYLSQHDKFENLVKTQNFLKNQIIKKGTQTYENLKSNKNDLFFSSKYKFTIPNENWFETNKEYLKELSEKLSYLQDRIITVENSPEITGGTLGEVIKFFKNKLDNDKPYFTTLIEKDGNYSTLPKVDTNYTNWARILDKVDSEKKLGIGKPKDKINVFFDKQFPLDKIASEEDKLFIRKNTNIITLSYAEYELFKESKKDFKPTLEKIQDTTNRGNAAEKRFKTIMQRRGINIINFSTPGSIPDMRISIDMLVKNIGNWVPIQVKSNPPQFGESSIFKLDGFLVYPEGKDAITMVDKNGKKTIIK